ncbi:MAG: class I SAM-dependent methyltransferase [Planctomycetes bacterium]|nr:class I SAM-dependent methyltransferase [Planctomycetota bacterium]
MTLMSVGIDAVERGLVPDRITRIAIQRLCAQRLRDCEHDREDAVLRRFETLVQTMRTGPIAPVPEKANEQHYELPPQFFVAVLGPHRKYSACFFPTDDTSLAEAESAALEITCQRAGIGEGQTILELGCGWGSLSLWMAGRYRSSRITAVSNSAPQRRYIETEAALRGLTNLHVITADMNEFSAGPQCFDRVVSVEMFEHMRNYELLLERIASWLKPDGRLFVHHFCHRTLAYPYETEGDANWMGRYFFTGGLMPSENMLRQFDRHMTVINQWRWDGTHYQRTSEAWLANLDARRGELLPVLEATYGRDAARRWLHRWRMFFLAVAELFGYSGGSEWFVTQLLLQPNGT